MDFGQWTRVTRETNCHILIVHQPDSEPSESGENHTKQTKTNLSHNRALFCLLGFGFWGLLGTRGASIFLYFFQQARTSRKKSLTSAWIEQELLKQEGPWFSFPLVFSGCLGFSFCFPLVSWAFSQLKTKRKRKKTMGKLRALRREN